MNIKSARIVGVLQDWDIYSVRYDIERVNVNVPINELEAFTDDEIECMVDEGEPAWVSYNGMPLSKLVLAGIDNGWFKWMSRWEPEDPCELMLEIEEEGTNNDAR